MIDDDFVKVDFADYAQSPLHTSVVKKSGMVCKVCNKFTFKMFWACFWRSRGQIRCASLHGSVRETDVQLYLCSLCFSLRLLNVSMLILIK